MSIRTCKVVKVLLDMRASSGRRQQGRQARCSDFQSGVMTVLRFLPGQYHDDQRRVRSKQQCYIFDRIEVNSRSLIARITPC